MLKRTLIVLTMTVAMVVAAEPVQTVHGIIMTETEWLMANSAQAEQVDSEKQTGKGNELVRALKAPFKALGRLFGRGKKNSNRVQRISEEDAKKFESVPGTQVSKVTPGTESHTGYATENATGATLAGPTSAEALETLALDHLEKGRTLLDNHDLNGAIAELSRAASSNPKLSEASSLLGVAYWRKGLRDLAARSFENAVNIDKNDSQNLNNFGFLLYENGDYEKATKYLKRAAKLSPDDARIWNNLGLAQSERGHFDDAFESFARAQGEYKGHLNVAARLERRGSTRKAIKHLEKAIAIQPSSPEVLARLIQLYDLTGNEKQALNARNSLETLRAVAKTADK